MNSQKTLDPNVDSIETQLSSLEKITCFLKEIGIEYYISDEDFDSFLGGIKIENGKLKINPKNLTCIGDILHEAGHIACIPFHLRMSANDNISESIGNEYTCEMAVIAWSVAAALHLNIPLWEIFHHEGYNGDGKWLLKQFSSNNYIGLPLLQWLGLAAFEDELIEDEILPFPKMLRWTRI